MKLTADDIARMIDFSAVTGGTGDEQIDALIRDAKKHPFAAVMVPPCYVKQVTEQLGGTPLTGTTIGFPSGANTTETKVFESRLALEQGARELDMVINVGALLSGRYQYVEDDIRAVVDAAEGNCVKVILEVHFLDHDEIKKACELCIRAGAHFVKTATGWFSTGATGEHIALMKTFVGDAIRIKASGGVRDLDTLITLHQLGADRFGISTQAALNIVADCDALADDEVEI